MLVVDLKDEGTFDVSLLAVDSGVFDVMATRGGSRLGGDVVK